MSQNVSFSRFWIDLSKFNKNQNKVRIRHYSPSLIAPPPHRRFRRWTFNKNLQILCFLIVELELCFLCNRQFCSLDFLRSESRGFICLILVFMTVTCRLTNHFTAPDRDFKNSDQWELEETFSIISHPTNPPLSAHVAPPTKHPMQKLSPLPEKKKYSEKIFSLIPTDLHRARSWWESRIGSTTSRTWSTSALIWNLLLADVPTKWF